MANALNRYALGQNSLRGATPQTVRTPGRKDEVKNNAGGFVFKVDDKSRLERFLILGTDGGTYYVGEQKLTEKNIDFAKKMIAKDEALVLRTIVEVSEQGRAYRNTPAIFLLALVLSEGKDKAAARAVVNKVVRTGTHVFEFASFLDSLGGWGRAKRKAVANWYESKTAEELSYQAVKYRQRNGWTHRDLFRLSHPEGVDSTVGAFILGRPPEFHGDYEGRPAILGGFEGMQAAGSAKEVVRILSNTSGGGKNLPWETIPTQFLKDVDVWKTLFYNGQVKGQALVRNITRLARIGAFKDMKFAGDYAKALTDVDMIRKTRLHPIQYLNALIVYTEGQVDRRGNTGWYGGYRSKDWNVEPVISDALNEGFHLAFKTLEPAQKRTLLAVDVSGSMGQMANGLDLTCSQVSAALAMTIARTEPYYKVMGFATEFRDLGIAPGDNLARTLNKVSNQSFGGTDIALPMTWAAKNKVEVDTFGVITDNETWAGGIKPFQALKKYREQTGIPARLAVFGVAATPFTIADPNDAGMMDFVGFDSNAPRVFADFSAGRL